MIPNPFICLSENETQHSRATVRWLHALSVCLCVVWCTVSLEQILFYDTAKRIQIFVTLLLQRNQPLVNKNWSLCSAVLIDTYGRICVALPFCVFNTLSRWTIFIFQKVYMIILRISSL